MLQEGHTQYSQFVILALFTPIGMSPSGPLRFREAMRLNPYHPEWYWNYGDSAFNYLPAVLWPWPAFLRLQAAASLAIKLNHELLIAALVDMTGEARKKRVGRHIPFFIIVPFKLKIQLNALSP